jgi:hypothetical protein
MCTENWKTDLSYAEYQDPIRGYDYKVNCILIYDTV